VLELNVDHSVIAKIKTLFEKDAGNPVLKKYSQLLLDMALISEGSKVDNPAEFSQTIGELMSNAIQV